METSIGLLLLIQVVLIALNAVFASAEIAVLSFNDLKLQKMAEQGNKRAARLRKLTVNPARFLATIQVAITLSGFLGSAFAAENFSDSLTDWILGFGINIPRNVVETFSVILITLILSYVTLIFGELVPKRIAMKKSEHISLALSGLICGISTIFTPLVSLLSISTNAVLKLCGIDPDEEEEEMSVDEIRMMIDASSEKGAIGHEEKEFIHNVFEFNELEISELSTHRTDTIFLRMEDSEEEWNQIIHDNRHTLYPICQDTPDHVIGILNAKDYFRLKDRSRENLMKEVVKPAYFVPESIKADALFQNMKKSSVSMAVVLDEYGGMTGIITLNDLIEQLVGDLNDEETTESEREPYMEPCGEHKWLVHGNINLRDIEEAADIELDHDSFDTITGLVFDKLCMIPFDGKQEMTIQIGRMAVTIMLILDHEIEEAMIRIEPEAKAQDSEQDHDEE